MSSPDKMEGFSSSLFGGFSRRDVIKYVERLSNEHEEETNARIKEMDVLKARLAEREDELRKMSEKLDAAESQNSEDAAKIKSLADELNQHKSAATAASAERDKLRALLDKHESDSKEYENWRQRLASYKKAVAELNEAKVRIANIELEAYQRAEQIEKAAAAKAQEKLAEFRVSVAALKDKFDMVRTEVNLVLSAILEQADSIHTLVDQMRLEFNEQSDTAVALFEDDDLKIEELSLDDELDGLMSNIENMDFDGFDEFNTSADSQADEPDTDEPDTDEATTDEPDVNEDADVSGDPFSNDSNSRDEPLPENFGEIFSDGEETKYDKYME